MECFGTNATHNQSLKSQKYFLGAQILLRILGIIFTVAATWIILTSKHTTVSVFDIQINAHISYPPTLKFFAYANIIGCGFSVLSLLITSILGHKVLDPNNLFHMFIHDLIVMGLLLAGCAAATAIGFVGKYGVRQAGWMPICDHVPKFCHRVADSVMLSYLGVLFYLCLTIISVNRSTHS
ncbi:CASP-like protein 1F1 [Nicotiana tomentosiformis]|uniref:CASP-like protein 1F1 n=1 Tax=Nicotiana tomentosiformis TaxID=4098 RepID=UPI00051C00EF|nr:CASP-like protein 1F1 [Nicotiana tomentosiformis]